MVAFMNPEITFTLPPYQTAARRHRHDRPYLRALVFWRRRGSCDRQHRGGIIRYVDRRRRPRSRRSRRLRCARHHVGRACSPTTSRGRAARLRADGSWAAGESHGLEHELSAFDTSITHRAAWRSSCRLMRYVWREHPEPFLAVRARRVRHRADRRKRRSGGRRGDGGRRRRAAGIFSWIWACRKKPWASSGFTSRISTRSSKTLRATKATTFGAFKTLTMDDAKATILSAFADPALPSLEEAGRRRRVAAGEIVRTDIRRTPKGGPPFRCGRVSRVRHAAARMRADGGELLKNVSIFLILLTW